MPDDGWPADRIDTASPHPARISDYLLGGKDYYPADQEAGEALCREWPALPVHMRASRDFMHRTVRHLAAEEGIRQFLDIGTGIPTSPNLHEIAQGIAPDSRVVYVANDPIVLTLSQGLLSSSPEGRTAYVEADMRDPAAILSAPALRETLDLSRPVALTVIAIVHFVLDEDDAYGIIRRLLEPLAPGSFLAMSVGTGDSAPDEARRVADEYAARGMPMRLRDRAEAAEFFRGLDLVAPGLTQVHKWRPDASCDGMRDGDIGMYGALGRKA
ncbi:SAM-dependent methyltransferase [Streptomyces sp. NPDC005925]|uniref:SAM-dependent methyltransferase n=1 Tax=Streptomyces sp. NPDC005925 TaxID=3157172 RepID=UPI0033F1BA57